MDAGANDSYRKYIGFAISPTNVPYIAYTGKAHGHKACVRSFNAANNSWDAVGALGFTPGTGLLGDDDFFSLLFRDNIPFITLRNAASSATEGQILMYAFI